MILNYNPVNDRIQYVLNQYNKDRSVWRQIDTSVGEEVIYQPVRESVQRKVRELVWRSTLEIKSNLKDLIALDLGDEIIYDTFYDTEVS